MCLFRLADSRRFTTFYPAPGAGSRRPWMDGGFGRPERDARGWVPMIFSSIFLRRSLAAFDDGHGSRALASP